MRPDRINLLSSGMRKSRINHDLLLVACWAVVLSVIVAASFQTQRNTKEMADEYTRLAETASAMGQNVDAVSKKAKSADELNQKISDAQEFLDAKILWTDAFKELTLLLPESVWLTSLISKTTEEGAATLEIVGSASSQRKIAAFLESLERSDHFRGVNLKKTEKIADVVPDLYQFTFEVEVPQLIAAGEHGKGK